MAACDQARVHIGFRPAGISGGCGGRWQSPCVAKEARALDEQSSSTSGGGASARVPVASGKLWSFQGQHVIASAPAPTRAMMFRGQAGPPPPVGNDSLRQDQAGRHPTPGVGAMGSPRTVQRTRVVQVAAVGAKSVPVPAAATSGQAAQLTARVVPRDRSPCRGPGTRLVTQPGSLLLKPATEATVVENPSLSHKASGSMLPPAHLGEAQIPLRVHHSAAPPVVMAHSPGAEVREQPVAAPTGQEFDLQQVPDSSRALSSTGAGSVRLQFAAAAAAASAASPVAPCAWAAGDVKPRAVQKRVSFPRRGPLPGVAASPAAAQGWVPAAFAAAPAPVSAFTGESPSAPSSVTVSASTAKAQKPGGSIPADPAPVSYPPAKTSDEASGSTASVPQASSSKSGAAPCAPPPAPAESEVAAPQPTIHRIISGEGDADQSESSRKWQPSTPDAQIVQYDDEGRPMVERHRNQESQEYFTVVFYDDGSRLLWTYDKIATIAIKAEVDILDVIKEMSFRELRGFVHEASMQVVERSGEYHKKKEKLEEMGEQVDHVFFGLPPDACIKDVEAAYRKLARAMHPDKNRDVPDAKEQFQSMKARYERLMAKLKGEATPAMGKKSSKQQTPTEKKAPEALLHADPFGVDEDEQAEAQAEESTTTTLAKAGNGPTVMTPLGEMDEKGWIRQEPGKPQPAGKSLKVEFTADDGSMVYVKARNMDMMWTRALDGRRVARKMKFLKVEEGDTSDEFVLEGPFGSVKIVDPPPGEQLKVVRQLVCLVQAYKLEVHGAGLDVLDSRQTRTASTTMAREASQASQGQETPSEARPRAQSRTSEAGGRQEAYEEDPEESPQGPTVERLSFDFNDRKSLEGMALKMLRQMKIIILNSDILNEKFRKMDEEADPFHNTRSTSKRPDGEDDSQKENTEAANGAQQEKSAAAEDPCQDECDNAPSKPAPTPEARSPEAEQQPESPDVQSEASADSKKSSSWRSWRPWSRA
mmetsp:Transcript_54182/g.129044  ORF Transcript_54182/g.129044 Transcript_54182/m.129044 type:complete len:986 (-) Transcript_54182:147-3104(-)